MPRSFSTKSKRKGVKSLLRTKKERSRATQEHQKGPNQTKGTIKANLRIRLSRNNPAQANRVLNPKATIKIRRSSSKSPNMTAKILKRKKRAISSITINLCNAKMRSLNKNCIMKRVKRAVRFQKAKRILKVILLVLAAQETKRSLLRAKCRKQTK